MANSGIVVINTACNNGHSKSVNQSYGLQLATISLNAAKDGKWKHPCESLQCELGEDSMLQGIDIPFISLFSVVHG